MMNLFSEAFSAMLVRFLVCFCVVRFLVFDDAKVGVSESARNTATVVYCFSRVSESAEAVLSHLVSDTFAETLPTSIGGDAPAGFGEGHGTRVCHII